MIITIDGPVATGKSSIAKRLARQIGFIYFDTGAMYRSLAYAVLKLGTNPENKKEILSLLDHFSFTIRFFHGDPHYYLNDEDISLEIRSPEVTALVSPIAAIPEVRAHLIKIQHQYAEGVNAVFEGRDMGTTIFPKAEIKIFLTGDPEVRANRRFKELKEKFPEKIDELSFAATLEQINARDHYDSSRKISPLRQPEDAYVIDTSDLSIDDIVLKILEYKDSLRTEHNLSEGK